MMPAAQDSTVSRISAADVCVSAQTGGVELIAPLAEDWRQLCIEGSEGQPFYRPEWIEAYLRAFAPGATLVLITARHNDLLQLVLPLIKEKSSISGIPVVRLRAPVNSHPGRFDVVRRSGPQGDAAMAAVWDHLQKRKDWDLLQIDYAPESGNISHLSELAQERGFASVQIRSFASPVITVPSDRDLLSKMPPNGKLRSQLKQARRQLEQTTPMSLRRFENLDRDALNRFYELEASGWKGQEGSAIISDQRTRQFYDEIAESAGHHNYFCLYLLEWNGQLLAAHFGLCHNGRYYSPKVAYDEKMKKFALGHLILSEIVNDCASRGIREIDITGPDDDWKMKWTSAVRDHHTHFIFNKGIRARLAYQLRFRVRPAVGRLIRRKRSGA
jgi:CelD/BcsL family acetyltransferase involved in cellulose biosynthesis